MSGGKVTGQEAEVTLRQILKSSWMAMAWRLALFALPFVAGASVWVLNDIKGQGAETAAALIEVRADVANIKLTQQIRADQVDTRNVQVDQVLDKVSRDVQSSNSSLVAVQLAVAKVSGMLEQMQKDHDKDMATALHIR